MKKILFLCAALLAFASNDEAQSIEYAQDSVKRGWVYNPDCEDDDCWVEVEYDTETEFPCGIDSLYKFFKDNIQYPQEAKEKGISGTVYITFTVKEDGSTTWEYVLRDIGGGCGQEAIRVAKLMPKWKPAMYKNKPVAVNFNLPVNFILNKE